MIDGDDHNADGRDEREGDGHDRDGDVSTVEDSQPEGNDETADEGGRPEEPQAEVAESEQSAEETRTDDDQPAMDLEGGSDEGGTIDSSVEPQDADQDHAEPETLADDGAFDGAALDELDDEPMAEDDDLGLVSDDDALPWLESSDYDDIESVDAWRITGFVVMGLVVLALIVGGIWYFTKADDAGAPAADGSTIAAPEGPYKERPEEPGGKTFKGTGDMAPAVGEGETREGRLAAKSATPEPVAPEPASAAEEPAPAPAKPAATDNRIAVQVGAYRDQSTAEAGWRALQRQTDALSGVEYRIVKGEADIGTVYRLQALPGNMAAARRLSDALKADGVASQIKQ